MTARSGACFVSARALRRPVVVPAPLVGRLTGPRANGHVQRENGADARLSLLLGHPRADTVVDEPGVGIEVDDVAALLMTRQAEFVGGDRSGVAAPDGVLAERLRWE